MSDETTKKREIKDEILSDGIDIDVYHLICVIARNSRSDFF